MDHLHMSHSITAENWFQESLGSDVVLAEWEKDPWNPTLLEKVRLEAQKNPRFVARYLGAPGTSTSRNKFLTIMLQTHPTQDTSTETRRTILNGYNYLYHGKPDSDWEALVELAKRLRHS